MCDEILIIDIGLVSNPSSMRRSTVIFEVFFLLGFPSPSTSDFMASLAKRQPNREKTPLRIWSTPPGSNKMFLGEPIPSEKSRISGFSSLPKRVHMIRKVKSQTYLPFVELAERRFSWYWAFSDNFARHQLARALALESAGWGEFSQPVYLKCTDASQENDGLKVKQELKTDTIDGFRNPANQLIYR